MNRTFTLLACAGALLLAACTSESNLPTPTGKGAIRAINAIPGSPELGFLIEEVSLGGFTYKSSTAPEEYDDFSYNFSFQILYPGDQDFTRLATETLKVEADRDHIFLLTGDVNAPTVTVWNGDIRTFDAADTVLEARFSHASTLLGAVDVYFDPPGVAPGTNPPAATLSFGEIVDPADFEAGPYVLTVTAAGDPGIVHFESDEASLLAQFAHVITIFDGDENDTAPIHVRSMTSVGNPLVFTDANYPPQVRFIHAARTLEAVDIYDDDVLTSLVYAGLDLKGTTGYLDTLSETRTFYFTPANSIATILFEQEISAPALGSYADIYLFGDTDAWAGVRFIPDRQRVSISFKVRLAHGALNHAEFDVYLTERDVPLTEDDLPTLVNVAYGLVSPRITLAEREVDLYITVRGERTIIAGPYPIDATLGGSLELLVVDTVDPATAEIVDITAP
ncbi:MAG: DUF4397 domain-containing protein [Gammaproteobacteria bacterium]|nr:DUF4397 domain-containing protein [Gammaproteobacteria bacterium]